MVRGVFRAEAIALSAAARNAAPSKVAPPRNTYSRVQLSIGFAFLLLLVLLAALRVEGDALYLAWVGRALPALCSAEITPCASCGLTRGMVALLDLDTAESSRRHAAAWPLLLLLLAQLILRPVLAGLGFRGRAALLSGVVDFTFHFALTWSLVNGSALLK